MSVEGRFKKVIITFEDDTHVEVKDQFGIHVDLKKLEWNVTQTGQELTAYIPDNPLPILIERTVYNKMPAYRWGPTGEPFPYFRGDPKTKREAQIACFNWAIENDLWEGDPEAVL